MNSGLLQQIANPQTPHLITPLERQQASLASINAIQQTQGNAMTLQHQQQQLQDASRQRQLGEAIHGVLAESGGAITPDVVRKLAALPGMTPDVLNAYHAIAQNEETGRINKDVLARKAAEENFAALNGSPAEEQQVGQSGTQTPPSAIPSGGKVAPIQAPIPAGFTQELPLPAQTIPGIPDLGIPSVTRQPQSQRQIFEQKQREKAAELNLQREANTYTITDPTTGKTITAPKDIIDNILTQTGENARKNTLTPPAAVGEYSFYAQQEKAAGRAPLSFDAWQDRDANRKKPVTNILTSAPGNFDKTGKEFLETLPKDWRTIVKKIGDYDLDPTKVASMRGGTREQIMKWVSQYNPDYDQTKFGNIAPTRKAFTTGTQGQQINAINTAIGHIDQLPRVSAALKNGSFVPGNELYNFFKTAFGASAVTNFETLKDALAGEVASVLSKGQATVSGIAAEKAKMGAANSPEQLAGYVKTLLPIMGSKLAALNDEYQKGTFGHDPTFSALSEESKTVLRRNGLDPEHPLASNNGAAAQQPPAFTLPNGTTVRLQSDGTYK